MRKILLSVFVAVAITLVKAENINGIEFLESLQGTYIELFDTRTCLNPEYDELWKTEATKCVGKENAEAAIKGLLAGCSGELIGEDAVTAYENGGMSFCCSFMQGIAKLTFAGNYIFGIDNNGKTVFAHNYCYVGMDGEGNYIYESTDGNNDEFRYFWMRPDSPKQTFHIEFRYGSDKDELARLMTGKYAYWMASAVREGQTDEYRNSIILFINENLGTGE